MVVVVGILDEDVDLGEADRDGDADASRAIGDRQFAVLFRDDRRLEDADGADAGGKRRVRHFAGLDFSGIAGVLLQDAGIDATQFHLFSPGFVSSRVFLEDEIRRARASRPGQRRREAPGLARPASAAGRTRPLRRTGVPCLKVCYLPLCFRNALTSALFLIGNAARVRERRPARRWRRRRWLRTTGSVRELSSRSRRWSARLRRQVWRRSSMRRRVSLPRSMTASSLASLRSITAARSLFMRASTSSAFSVAAASMARVSAAA